VKDVTSVTDQVTGVTITTWSNVRGQPYI